VIPESVEDDQAVFVEPLAAAFQVVKQLGPQGRAGSMDDRRWVTVLGDGRLGLLVAQVLRNAGYPVRVIGKHPVKLALCEKWSIRALAEKEIDVTSMIARRMKLDQGVEAMRLAGSAGVMKVILTMM
jgi:threonine dehydrogenase-like Zn-dependent dehydrogenase